MKQFMISMLLILMLLGCEPISSYEPETRPSSVPNSALWIGGPDGGVYLRIHNSENNYSGTIYFENTGEIWYQGPFEYSGTDQLDITNWEVFSSWDGEILYLVNGQKLVSSDFQVKK